MSTADVARDMDLLRQAVGDAKITYLGFSYGSYLGNTYANMFPKNVRALVIDGVLDPRLWSSGFQIVSDRVATEAEFVEFLRLCDEAGPDCAFAAPEGSRARWEALARRDQGATARFRRRVRLHVRLPDQRRRIGAMYAPETWGGPDGYGAFFDFLADAVLGDQAAAANAGARAGIADRTAEAGAVDRARLRRTFFDAYFGNQCADTQYPSLVRRRSCSRTATPPAGVASSGRTGGGSTPGAPTGRSARDRYVGPWTARTSAPVLVVGNYFDGVTDYAGAQASASLLRNSRLLSYAGWGHTAYGRSACVTGYVDAYLVDGTLPPVDTVCPANPNPFVPSLQRTAATSVPRIGLPPGRLLHQ